MTTLESEVVDRLAEARVLPVTTVDDADQAEHVAQALVRGGLPCVEIAFRSPAAAIRRARRVNASSSARARSSLPIRREPLPRQGPTSPSLPA